MKSIDPDRLPLTILRICQWFVPGLILLLGFILALSMGIPFRIALSLVFCVFIALGYFDMRLKLQIEKVDAKPLKKRVLGWAVAFAFVQMIIAPAVAGFVAVICLKALNKGIFYP